MERDLVASSGKGDGLLHCTLRQLSELKHITDNDADYVEALDMLGELREDNQALIARMIEIHDLCDEANDFATASSLENWIDQAQHRVWFLFETSRAGVKG